MKRRAGITKTLLGCATLPDVCVGLKKKCCLMSFSVKINVDSMEVWAHKNKKLRLIPWIWMVVTTMLRVSHNRVEELSRKKNKNMAAISCQSPVCPLIFAHYCIRPTDFLRNQMGKLKIATSTIIQVGYKDMDKEMDNSSRKEGRYLVILFYYCWWMWPKLTGH